MFKPKQTTSLIGSVHKVSMARWFNLQIMIEYVHYLPELSNLSGNVNAVGVLGIRVVNTHHAIHILANLRYKTNIFSGNFLAFGYWCGGGVANK